MNNKVEYVSDEEMKDIENVEVDKNIEKVKVGQKIRVNVEKNYVFDF